ncbi:MAG: hypothetical protein NTY39_12400 [Campylobacterales bacterium]|nr:hypothetical protein [Campylobacterales bacterium]
MESDLITFFIGIIAVCMVIITIVAVRVSLEVYKSINQFNECMAYAQSEFKFLSAKMVLTLNEVQDVVLKISSGIAKVTLGSLLIGAVSNIFKKKSN